MNSRVTIESCICAMLSTVDSKCQGIHTKVLTNLDGIPYYNVTIPVLMTEKKNPKLNTIENIPPG